MSVSIPQEDLDGNVTYVNKSYTWPLADNFNIDISSPLYATYLSNLLSIGDAFDAYKTDLIYRELIPNSLKMYDLTSAHKVQELTRVLGRQIDDIRIYINQLAHINNISYDKIDNTPDLLVKNLAATLGWDVFNIINQDDLFNSVFSIGTTSLSPVQSTPSELETEVWRRIILNTAYLFKSKGTRKAVQALFALIGVPDCLVNIEEYVYLASGPINPNTVDLQSIFPLNEQLTRLPFDGNGFPVAASPIDSYYFQTSGTSDGGQAYLNVYRSLGFNLTKVVDNTKSWPYVTASTQSTNRYDGYYTVPTSYNLTDSRLVINTKEILLNLDPIQAIECDVYNFNLDNNYPVSSNGRPYPYPQQATADFDTTQLTFNEYVHQIYSNFINARNRKVTTDFQGGGYPTLYKLYYDYLYNSYRDIGVQSNAYTVSKMFDYINTFDSLYQKFIFQVIPATTIIAGQGETIRNTVFTPQKFVYKHGINDGSEFVQAQPVNTSTSLKLPMMVGSVGLPYTTDINIWQSSGTYSYTSGNGSGGGSGDQFLFLSIFLHPEARFCNPVSDVFAVPSYTMSGATKIIQSATTIGNGAVYYYDNDVLSVGKPVNFIFTGNTSSLYPSSVNFAFTYNVFPYNYSTSAFTTTSAFKQVAPYTAFSSSTTLNALIPKLSLSADTEYLIKGSYSGIFYNILSANTLTYQKPYNLTDQFNVYVYPTLKNIVDFYFDPSTYSGLTGYTFNTQEDYSFLNFPYKMYEQAYDWYFVSVSNPEQPVIQGLTAIPPNQVNPFLKTEQLIPDPTSSQFITNLTPIGDIHVALNGSTLLNGTEYSLVTNVISSLQGRVYLLNVPYNPVYDVLTVFYFTAGNSAQVVGQCTQLTYIPSGTTQVLPYNVLYNTSLSSYEYFLNAPVSGGSSNLMVTWNGSTLSPTLDYSLSVANASIVVFSQDLTLHTGDTICAYYLSGSSINVPTVYNINSTPYVFNWQTPDPILNPNGEFVLEFSQQYDTFFTGITASASTPYVYNQSKYSLAVNFLTAPFNGLQPGSIYNLRIMSIKDFQTLGGAQVQTYAYSPSVQIKAPV